MGKTVTLSRLHLTKLLTLRSALEKGGYPQVYAQNITFRPIAFCFFLRYSNPLKVTPYILNMRLAPVIKSYWKKGDRARLAELSYTHKNNLYEILARKRGVSKEKAMTLQKAAELLGYSIPFEIWLFNKSTLHPAFYGKPVEGVVI